MKALLFHGPGDLRLEDVPRPEPGPRRRARPGRGRAHRRHRPEGVPPRPSRPARRAAEPVRARVLRGRRRHRQARRRGELGARGDERGEPLELLNGAYAEYLLVPERIASVNLLPVPDGLASEVAAMVEPLACCLRGVERAEVGAGRPRRRPRRRPDRADALRLRRATRAARPRSSAAGPSAARSRPLFGASARRRRGRRRRDRGGRHGGSLAARARAGPARAAPCSSSAAASAPAARRRLPPPLRGAHASRRLPPRAAERPRGARLSRERRATRGSGSSRTGSGSTVSLRCSPTRRATTSRRPYIHEDAERTRAVQPVAAWPARLAPRTLAEVGDPGVLEARSAAFRYARTRQAATSGSRTTAQELRHGTDLTKASGGEALRGPQGTMNSCDHDSPRLEPATHPRAVGTSAEPRAAMARRVPPGSRRRQTGRPIRGGEEWRWPRARFRAPSEAVRDLVDRLAEGVNSGRARRAARARSTSTQRNPRDSASVTAYGLNAAPRGCRGSAPSPVERG